MSNVTEKLGEKGEVDGLSSDDFLALCEKLNSTVAEAGVNREDAIHALMAVALGATEHETHLLKWAAFEFVKMAQAVDRAFNGPQNSNVKH